MIPESESKDNSNFQVDVSADVDGITLISLNLDTMERKEWRLDKTDVEGRYMRYRLDQKPNTRTHEFVELGPDVVDYLNDHASFFV